MTRRHGASQFAGKSGTAERMRTRGEGPREKERVMRTTVLAAIKAGTVGMALLSLIAAQAQVPATVLAGQPTLGAAGVWPQAAPASEWTSLAVVATPDAPLMLTGNEDLPEGSLVATRRVGDTVTVPPASSLRIFADMAVFGTQGGLILANLAPSGDPASRRIFIREVNRGAEWHVAYQGKGAERAAPVLTLPGGEHGDFEFILD